MRPIADDRGVSVANIALAWLLHQEVVTSVIIGAKSMKQLEDNLNAVEVELGEDELNSLDEASALSPEYPQWMIARQSRGRKPGESSTFDRNR